MSLQSGLFHVTKQWQLHGACAINSLINHFMKVYAFAYLMLFSIRGFPQTNCSPNLDFFEPNKSPLAFIADQFYDRTQGLDSCCLLALGSVKFAISKNSRIDSVSVSMGTPKSISTALKKAVLASANHWKLTGKSKSVTVIIPFLIGPSSLCKKETVKDDIYTSAANMLSYECHYGPVKADSYYKKAKGAEVGLILPSLLIRGRTIDVYDPTPYIRR